MVSSLFGVGRIAVTLRLHTIKLITNHYALITIFAILLASCHFPDFKPEPPHNDDDLENLGENEFYAQDITNGKFYKLGAERLYEGVKCVIWAEEGSGVTPEQAEIIAREYDEKIRPKIVGAFSRKNIYTIMDGKRYDFEDMVEYANYLAGRTDRKLTILLLDIRDGFTDSQTDSYVAGYFFGNDLWPKGKIPGIPQYSNGRDMIYVDTYPGLEDTRQAYATFAHELQHLINYVTRRGFDLGSMDTWIDEGLSSQAEYLYLDENPQEKIEWFSADPEGTIAKGNNFFVWDNHQDKQLAIMDDYATVYLFFRWICLQAESQSQSGILYDIANSSCRDYRAVTNVARQINSSWSNWESLLRTWLAANYYPENTYGYTGDDYLQKTIKVEPITGGTVSLYPGEGVYSKLNNSFSASGGTGNIRYAGLRATTGTIGTSSPYTGDILLTFNANTNNGATAGDETGYVTGVSPPVPPRMAGESDQTRKITGPYVIDARDLLGRDSW